MHSLSFSLPWVSLWSWTKEGGRWRCSPFWFSASECRTGGWRQRKLNTTKDRCKTLVGSYAWGNNPFYLVSNHSQGILQVQLVVLISIDRPHTMIELWRGFTPSLPPSAQAARQREARMVWNRDWTNGATQFYIPLPDIFRGAVPAAYGNNDRVYLNSVYLRQSIIDTWN